MEYVWMTHPNLSGQSVEVPVASVAYYQSKGWYTVAGPGNMSAADVPVFVSPDDPADVLTVPGVQFQTSAGGFIIHARDADGNVVSATYVKVIQVMGDGTDKTTAINAALATGVAVGLTKEVRLVGEFTISAPLVIGSKTKLDATGATITLAAGSNCNMLRNAAVTATGTRDDGIDVVGGRWVRGTNAGTGINGHTFCFRRVDGLRVRPAHVSTGAGKYAVNLGDVTRFEADHIDFDTTSDGVHVNGPASNGSVHHITGTTHDDSVALTGNDYAAYADVTGNITAVTIGQVNTTSAAANLVKVLAGQGCTVNDITVDNVRGTFAQYAVWLGDDNGQAVTDNGTHGTLRVRDVRATGTAANGALVFGNLATGAERLDFRDIVIPASAPNIKQGVLIGVDATGVVKALSVDGVRAENGWGNTTNPRLVSLVCSTGAVFNDVEIRNAEVPAITNGRLLELSACEVIEARIINPKVAATETGTQWVSTNSAAKLGRLTVSGGRITAGKDILELAGTGPQIRAMAAAASITAASTALTGTGFTSADIGRMVSIPGAGAAGATLLTVITAVTSATSATVYAAAGTTVTNVTGTVYDPTTVTLTGGLYVTGVNQIVRVLTYAKVIFGDVKVASSVVGLVYAENGSAGLVVLGSGSAELPTSPSPHGRFGTSQYQRVNGLTMLANIGEMSARDGDTATTTVAKGSIPVGARVTYWAGVWKDLFSGATWTQV